MGQQLFLEEMSEILIFCHILGTGRNLSETYQKVARKLESCQKVARMLPECCQKFDRKLPECYNKDTRQLQKKCLTVARQLPENFHKVAI